MEIGELAKAQQEKKKKWVPVSTAQPIESGNYFAGVREGFYHHLKRHKP